MKTTLSRAVAMALFSSFVCAAASGVNAPTDLSATPVSPTQVTTSALKINVNAGLPMESSGTIAPQSTLLLVFDASGVLRKKIDYRIGHASSNVPPVVTTY